MECHRLAEKIPELPAPDPLQSAVVIEFHWGASRFEIFSSACSLRNIPWGVEEMTWLHCKAMRTAEVQFDEPTGMMNVLIPALYVTSIKPGPTFKLTRSDKINDIGLFPPNQSAPLNPVPLEEIERIIARLLNVERN
jgi:hypothetical protein